MNKCVERLYNGIIKENPTFVLMLRYVSDPGRRQPSAINGLGMGLSTTAVLMFLQPADLRTAEDHSGSVSVFRHTS